MNHLRSGVRDQPDQRGETPSLLKNTKISQVWWCIPVIPATWEAEAQESLEPGRWRLQGAEIAPLHSSLGEGARLHLKKKKKNTGWEARPGERCPNIPAASPVSGVVTAPGWLSHPMNAAAVGNPHPLLNSSL